MRRCVRRMQIVEQYKRSNLRAKKLRQSPLTFAVESKTQLKTKMKLLSLRVVNLHGYINKTIAFNDKMNILVGINGSGKTSVLNAINWLMKPVIKELCVNSFDTIQAEFTLDDAEYVITASQKENKLQVSLTNKTTRKKFTPLVVKLAHNPKDSMQNKNVQTSDLYERLVPEPKEREIWRFLNQTLRSPFVIGLDRSIFVQDNQIEYTEQIEDSGKRRYPSQQKATDPIEQVKAILSKTYIAYRAKVIKAHEKFKDDLVLSSFDLMTSESLLMKGPAGISQERINHLKNKSINFVRKYNKSDASLGAKSNHELFQKVENYFSSLDVVMKSEERTENYLLRVFHLAKLNSLINAFEIVEKETEQAYAEIKDFLDRINMLMSDSLKRFGFIDAAGQISFDVMDGEGRVISKNRDVSSLSSGERQILIIYTYLKFSSTTSRVFIIDEPELSLHPKWQKNFLATAEALMPSNGQLFVATHSPEVISKYRKDCIVLMPYDQKI